MTTQTFSSIFKVVVLGIAFLLTADSARAQVFLVVGDGSSSIDVFQGVDQRIPLSLSVANPIVSAGAGVIVRADALNPTEVGFDSNGSVFSNWTEAGPFSDQDLNIAPFGPSFTLGTGGSDFLGTLLLDTSSLNVGASFNLDFTESTVSDSAFQNILSTPPSGITVNVVSSVPEPSSMALLTGFFGLGLIRRRK